MAPQSQMPVQSGDRAPDFVVPAVHEDRTISLADYRGRTPVLLGLFRGLYCPFCRRALAQMAATSDNLRSLGVESLAIVGTDLDNARLYFKFRPTRMALGADPQLTTHRSYGVPRPEPTPELMQMVGNTYINPTGELPAPLPVPVSFPRSRFATPQAYFTSPMAWIIAGGSVMPEIDAAGLYGIASMELG